MFVRLTKITNIKKLCSSVCYLLVVNVLICMYMFLYSFFFFFFLLFFKINCPIKIEINNTHLVPHSFKFLPLVCLKHQLQRLLKTVITFKHDHSKLFFLRQTGNGRQCPKKMFSLHSIAVGASTLL